MGQKRGIGVGSGRAALALPVCLALAACAPRLPEQPVPVLRPTPAPAPVLAPAPQSRIGAHFQALQDRRLAQRLLRTDPAPRDLPFSARDLEDIFVRVALREEYVLGATTVRQQETPSPLRRWAGPVRMGMTFGASVPAAQQGADEALVRGYAARLAAAARHPVTLGGPASANFHVLVLSEEERISSAPLLRRLVPGIDGLTEAIITQMPLSVSCLVLAFSRTGDNVYTDAIAVIRAELPDLSRAACYYEELAQGLGLSNDSPRARPSMFNDAAEFAVLTNMDAALLRMLYDPRLRPGLSEAAARPIIRAIASELKGGES
jgi:hypothetical protein